MIRGLLIKDTLCKSRLRVQPDKHNKCVIRSLLIKDTPCKSCLRVQPDKHNKCVIRSLLIKRHSVQKLPKGASRQAQQVRDMARSLLKTPCHSRLRVWSDQHSNAQREVYHTRQPLCRESISCRLQYKLQITYTQRRVTEPTTQINTIARAPHTTSAQPSG
jgi:hypothetical protein